MTIRAIKGLYNNCYHFGALNRNSAEKLRIPLLLPPSECNKGNSVLFFNIRRYLLTITVNLNLYLFIKLSYEKDQGRNNECEWCERCWHSRSGLQRSGGSRLSRRCRRLAGQGLGRGWLSGSTRLAIASVPFIARTLISPCSHGARCIRIAFVKIGSAQIPLLRNYPNVVEI